MKPISFPTRVFNHEINKIASSLAQTPSHLTRASLGLGAIAIEPAVDYFSNINASKEERRFSLAKTISKIVIGTLSGVLARYIGLKLGQGYFKKILREIAPELKKDASKAKEILENKLPGIHKDIIDKMLPEFKNITDDISKELPETCKQIATNFGDAVGFVTAALFTMFIEVPLIGPAMNKIMIVISPKKQENQNQKGVVKQ